MIIKIPNYLVYLTRWNVSAGNFVITALWWYWQCLFERIVLNFADYPDYPFTNNTCLQLTADIMFV